MSSKLKIIFYKTGLLWMFIAACHGSTSGTEPCVQGSNCRLPQCFCLNSSAPPSGFAAEDIPQIVVFAFDGSVNKASYGYYKHFFSKIYRNPNSCPIRATLFAKDRYTNHSMVRDLYRHGLEIAGNSLTGKLPISFWREANREEMLEEILKNRRRLSEKAGIPLNEIRGWRSPHIQPTGDIQFKILQQNGFEYDSSLYVQRRSLEDDITWPGTLQHRWPLPCETKPCPSNNYTLWEIPVIALLDHKQKYPCMTVGGCIVKPETESDAFQLLWRNFYNFYRSKKIPFIVNMKPGWLNTDYHNSALDRFILSLLDLNDVYIVTMHQLVQWMQNPTNLTDIHDFKPWKCPGALGVGVSVNLNVLSVLGVSVIGYVFVTAWA
ncbi:chitin deacetylase 1-like [Haliotis cracherodii]|uniref:chitin deacetylase 1-like n=1 Tax=Haliotis cracherodii TaxID=6455 RepID=UPI0039E7CEB8